MIIYSIQQLEEQIKTLSINIALFEKEGGDSTLPLVQLSKYRLKLLELKKLNVNSINSPQQERRSVRRSI
jgi:hypothetical protein